MKGTRRLDLTDFLGASIAKSSDTAHGNSTGSGGSSSSSSSSCGFGDTLLYSTDSTRMPQEEKYLRTVSTIIPSTARSAKPTDDYALVPRASVNANAANFLEYDNKVSGKLRARHCAYVLQTRKNAKSKCKTARAAGGQLSAA